ncbi:MAG: 50S ribosomal protein L5 [Candidatus Moranbacteria bacterium]|nr:50S ribosomal protein L5 [Candidatus Moranbacteria bacterium]
MKTSLIQERYKKEVVPEMKKNFKYSNTLAVPRIEKVVVNVGVGKLLRESGKIEEVESALKEITGQKPIKTKARKAISGFKIRQGLEIGMKITLRGRRMWQFIDRLVNATLPRIRDFQGIEEKVIDGKGNLNIGIQEHTIFPEISAEKVKNIFGFQVTVVINAKSHKEGVALFRALGFPIK